MWEEEIMKEITNTCDIFPLLSLGSLAHGKVHLDENGQITTVPPSPIIMVNKQVMQCFTV